MAVGRAYEDYFRPAAREAQLAAQNNDAGRAVRAKRREQDQPTRTTKKVAEVVGMSERQYRREKTIEGKAPEGVKKHVSVELE